MKAQISHFKRYISSLWTCSLLAKHISIDFPTSLKLHNRYYQRFEFRIVLFLQLDKYAQDSQNVFSLGFHQGYCNVIQSCNKKKIAKLLNLIHMYNVHIFITEKSKFSKMGKFSHISQNIRIYSSNGINSCSGKKLDFMFKNHSF